MQAGSLSVSSVYQNIDALVSEQAPRTGQAMLGARWGFGLPAGSAHHLTEYSFPLDRTPCLDKLRTRMGLAVLVHEGDYGRRLQEHLESGRPAIVAVDSFYLPYRPAYGRVHSSRTIVLRRGGCPGEVHVEDCWMPSYMGPLSEDDLARARFSTVPQDPKREPVFAGTAIGGVWFSVELRPIPVADIQSWGWELLALLHDEAVGDGRDSDRSEGIAALSEMASLMADLFGDRPEASDKTAGRRRAGLLLRAELSSRVYLCALLRAEAQWLRLPELRFFAERYYEGLDHMEHARDVLIKSLTHPRPEYCRCVADSLRRSHSNEVFLADAIGGLL